MHLRGPGRSRTCPGALRKPHPFVARKFCRFTAAPEARISVAREGDRTPPDPYR
jgi:hypothetical protein